MIYHKKKDTLRVGRNLLTVNKKNKEGKRQKKERKKTASLFNRDSIGDQNENDSLTCSFYSLRLKFLILSDFIMSLEWFTFFKQT